MTLQLDTFTVRADGLSGRKAEQYEWTVLSMLRSFEAFATGRALMKGFRFYREDVLVYPYDGAVGRCNARAVSTWGLFGTKVSISPQMFNGASSCFPQGSAGTSPHGVFFHELVHALRSVAGVWGNWPPLAEEAAAIMIADIFASETNSDLRDPLAPKSVKPVNVDPHAFVRVHMDLMMRFYQELPVFSRWIAEVDVPFNPVRIYYLGLKGVARLRNAP
jgi:hypothetical protein